VITYASSSVGRGHLQFKLSYRDQCRISVFHGGEVVSTDRIVDRSSYSIISVGGRGGIVSLGDIIS
jgi:hypothetical protein